MGLTARGAILDTYQHRKTACTLIVMAMQECSGSGGLSLLGEKVTGAVGEVKVPDGRL